MNRRWFSAEKERKKELATCGSERVYPKLLIYVVRNVSVRMRPFVALLCAFQVDVIVLL